MNSLLVSILIFSNPIGRDVPAEVVCRDVKSGLPAGPGAFLDAQEALAVVQMAESYERGCFDKTTSLAAARDEQEKSAVVTASSTSAAGGLAAGAGLLALLKRKKASK